MTVSVLTQDPNNKINVKKKKGGGGREVWVGVVGGGGECGGNINGVC